MKRNDDEVRNSHLKGWGRCCHDPIETGGTTPAATAAHCPDWGQEDPAAVRGEPSQPWRFQAGMDARRRRLHLLTAALIALISAYALFGGWSEIPVDQGGRPPLTEPTLFLYRSDGGQTASTQGALPPNTLTSLNCGRAIDLKSARPTHLAHLPSLGPNSAAQAVASGCLSSRQRKTLDGLIIESCDLNNF